MQQTASNAVDAPALQDIEGTVKWFDPRKGFGFIIGPDGQDIFCHYSAIQGDGFRVLKDGARVRYSAAHTDKGWKASTVTALEDPKPRRRQPRRGPDPSPADAD